MRYVYVPQQGGRLYSRLLLFSIFSNAWFGFGFEFHRRITVSCEKPERLVGKCPRHHEPCIGRKRGQELLTPFRARL